MIILSIVIPTYNRPGPLAERLVELASQACSLSDVEIVVLDNASAHPLEIPDSARWVKTVRNPANIGLAANICRAVETASGAWVWVLGDDDAVSPLAVPNIINHLREYHARTDIAAVNFSTGIYTHSKSEVIEGQVSFWDCMQRPLLFSNFLFISATIHRRECFMKYLPVAYHACVTMAPHFAVLMAAVRDGWRISISDIFIVSWRRASEEEHWNLITVTAGLPLLADVPGCSDAYKRLEPALMLNGRFALNYRNAMKLVFRDEKRGAGFWYAYYSRVVPCLTGVLWVKALIFRAIAGMAFKNDFFRRLVAFALRRITVKPDTMRGLNRL